MKNLTCATILFFTFCLAADSQTNENSCPQISLDLSHGPLVPDQPVILSANIDKVGEKYKLLYEWTLSSGRILSGQGTSKIEFTAEDQDQGTNIRAAVKIFGLPKKCADTFSDVMGVVASLPEDPLDELGRISLNDIKARLDNMRIQIINNSKSTGLIQIVFDKKDSRSYKISRFRNISKFFEFRKLSLDRISIAFSEGDYEHTILWLIPLGAKLPKSVDSGYKIVECKNLKKEINRLFS